jgi:hypothetical protein
MPQNGALPLYSTNDSTPRPHILLALLARIPIKNYSLVVCSRLLFCFCITYFNGGTFGSTLVIICLFIGTTNWLQNVRTCTEWFNPACTFMFYLQWKNNNVSKQKCLLVWQGRSQGVIGVQSNLNIWRSPRPMIFNKMNILIRHPFLNLCMRRPIAFG